MRSKSVWSLFVAVVVTCARAHREDLQEELTNRLQIQAFPFSYKSKDFYPKNKNFNAFSAIPNFILKGVSFAARMNPTELIIELQAL